jgi:hypothetical protein
MEDDFEEVDVGDHFEYPFEISGGNKLTGLVVTHPTRTICIVKQLFGEVIHLGPCDMLELKMFHNGNEWSLQLKNITNPSVTPINTTKRTFYGDKLYFTVIDECSP